MSDFGGLVRDDTSEDKAEAKNPESKAKSSSKSKSNASLASVLGADDVASLTRKYDLDPELGERVLVPLVNFLDKYGVGDAVNESPTVSGIMSLAEFWNDIAPVAIDARRFSWNWNKRFSGRKDTTNLTQRRFVRGIPRLKTHSECATVIGFSSRASMGTSWMGMWISLPTSTTLKMLGPVCLMRRFLASLLLHRHRAFHHGAGQAHATSISS